MLKFILILLLFGCVGSNAGGVVAQVGEVIQSAPVVEGQAYFSLLPWALVVCALGVFLFGWYTPSPRDNVPCTVIAGVLMALSMAVAKNGQKMADVATWACYASAIVCIIFYVKGYIQKHFMQGDE